MKMSYEKLKPTLKTGDIILFSGRYEMSKLVEWLEGSKWSHVAMVVRLDGFDEPLLYEATALTNLPDLITGDHITGPKVVNLLERLKTYGDDVKPYQPPQYCVRKLEKPLDPSCVKVIRSTLKQLHGLPNPGEWRMIYEVLAGRFLHINTGLKDITCSGFIAYTYHALGLLDLKMPINGFVPKDFSSAGKLKILNNSLGEEILIDLEQQKGTDTVEAG